MSTDSPDLSPDLTADLDVPAALRELLARQHITETLYAYSDSVDRCDLGELVDLFTEDAVFDYGHGQLFTGRDALGDLFADRLGRYVATNHHCSTVRFTSLTDSTAETVTYVYAFHDSGETHVHVWGRYEDLLVREADRWRIQRRRVRVAGVKTTPADAVPERFERYLRAPLS